MEDISSTVPTIIYGLEVIEVGEKEKEVGNFQNQAAKKSKHQVNKQQQKD